MLKAEEKSFRFTHEAMSTFFEVFIGGQEEAYARSAAAEFFREIDRLEEFLSRFDQRSEIARINRLKLGEVLPISYETFECLKLSFQIMVETGGAFNINFRALKSWVSEKNRRETARKENVAFLKKSPSVKGSHWKTEMNERKSPDVKREVNGKKTDKESGNSSRNREPHHKAKFFETDSAAAAKNFLSHSADLSDRHPGKDLKRSEKDYLWLFPLELVESGGNYAAVRLDLPGLSLDLDLGAVGKGYALNRAAEVLTAWDIDEFLVSAGGSTVLGCGQKPWPVAVGGGFEFFKPGKIYLKNRALSGSGHEVKGEHIFDPRLGRSRSRHLAAWVSHPSPVVADALSTAFMVMSLDEIESYCKARPEVWTLIISRDKKSHLFNRMSLK